MITAPRLRAFCPATKLAEVLAPVFNAQLDRFHVTTLNRRAHLMGQLAHESGGFRALSENLNYSAERIPKIWPRLAPRAQELAHNPEGLANAAYGNRMGNGNEASGDGWKFRGRGVIQLTGRDNYKTHGAALGLDLLGNPDLAASPENAVVLALSYWRSHGCNEAADKDDVRAVTKLINPALAGLLDRTALTAKAKGIFT